MDKDEVIVLKSKDALEYHLRELLKIAKREIIINFPQKLLQDFNQLFIELSKRGITHTFYINEKEYNDEQVKLLIDNDKIVKCIKKKSKAIFPIVMIVDKELSLVIFQNNFKEGLLIRNREMVFSQLYSLEQSNQQG